MKTKLLALLLMAGGAAIAGPRFFFGVGVGTPGYYYAPAPVYAPVVRYAPPAPVVAYVPPAPGPGYAWVGGYWYPAGAHYAWRAGYWARRPFVGAYWVGPRWSSGHYYRGYWRR